jgi:hypothetical protein
MIARRQAEKLYAVPPLTLEKTWRRERLSYGRQPKPQALLCVTVQALRTLV